MITYQVGLLNKTFSTFAEYRIEVCEPMEVWLQENLEGRYQFIKNPAISPHHAFFASTTFVGIDFVSFNDALAFYLVFSHGLEDGIWEYGDPDP